jgi:hypothetical protein
MNELAHFARLAERMLATKGSIRLSMENDAAVVGTSEGCGLFHAPM